MRPVIRVYDDATDCAQVQALWQAVLGYAAGHNALALVIARKLAVDDGLFFVAQAQGAVVGTVMAGYDGHRGWLYAVAVDPAHRQAGLGRALVRHAEAALAGRGCLKINLQLLASNAGTTAFYAALGYQVEPRISMGRVLHENLPGATGR